MGGSTRHIRKNGRRFIGATRIAVDTESNSLHAYREQVCLIQFSTPKRDYVLDPFAFEDLSRLLLLFSNPDSKRSSMPRNTT
jgi:ribonuclease D